MSEGGSKECDRGIGGSRFHCACGLYFRWAQLDQELHDELHDHLERTTQEYVAKGIAPDEAHRRARLDLGGIDQTRELLRNAPREDLQSLSVVTAWAGTPVADHEDLQSSTVSRGRRRGLTPSSLVL